MQAVVWMGGGGGGRGGGGVTRNLVGENRVLVWK